MASPTLTVENKVANIGVNKITHVLRLSARGIQGIKGDLGNLSDSFGSVSNNLSDFPATFFYDANDVLTSIEYNSGTGTITKTLNYNNDGLLESVVLSGNLPAGIQTTQNLSYDSDGILTGISYS